jgi:23S rRNA (adenine-C8)-methyltransferase
LKNLTPDEISDQLLYFYLQGKNIDSISFMGMGEPLANPHIFETLELLTNPKLFGLSQRRITISTVGIIPHIYEISERFPQIHLTFSLHSPFSDQRSELMPVNRIFPLSEVMKALDHHIILTKKKVYLAYVLLQGINDSSPHAQEIVTLVQKSKIPSLYHVDLIPYNSIKEKKYQKSDTLSQKNFLHILKKN